ncbi:MAG: hypothetical protein H5T50_08005, partial [Nitrososphaeria archaeon]|nr:hypothetical protein [Nitrososphaeria archaeon]
MLLQLLSYVTLAAALASIIVSYVIYNNPMIVESETKLKLLLLHAIERFVWLSLPLMLNTPNLMIIVYSLAQTLTIPVGVLITIAMFSQYHENEFVDLTVKRTAASSAASILGMIFSTYITASIVAPESYFIAYISSALVGLISTTVLVPYNIQPSIKVKLSATVSEEIEFKKINTYILFTFMM